jgi:hypothetical protein
MPTRPSGRRVNLNTMTTLLVRKAAQSLPSYFVVVWISAVVPSLILAVAISFVLRTPEPDTLRHYIGTDVALWQQVLQNAIIVPIVESALLIFPTAVAASAMQNRIAAAFVGAMPISLMHAWVSWAKPLVVFWFFFAFAYAYLELRSTRQSVRSAFLFVVLGHVLGNFLLTLASRLIG